MFLVSATFFPITTYPDAIQWVVRFSPLYHAVELLRALNLGTVGWAQLGQPLLSARPRGRAVSFFAQRRHREALAQVVQVVATLSADRSRGFPPTSGGLLGLTIRR